MARTPLERIKAVAATISEIIKVSGCPGATIGILHHDEVLHTEGFGFRDVENRLPPDENTIYYLNSLSKTFTASMIARLVEQGKLEWITPVSRILPSFQHWDDKMQEATIVDFLSHRSGLTPKNFIWNQEFGQASLKQ